MPNSTLKRKLLVLASPAADVGLVPEIAAAGWDVNIARDVGQGRAFLTDQDLLVGLALLSPCDDPSSMQWMEHLLSAKRHMEWIAVLAPECLPLKPIYTLIGEHCFDYHTLPIDAQRLLSTLGHAYGIAQLTERLAREQVKSATQYQMIGTCPAMQTLFRNIGKAASVGEPVLITGESGTGKELAARAIHEHSARSKGPFVAVNCAALPATLIQSELFGHEKGAFTGAHERRIGRIESAAGGTLFLDEIGNLPPDLQAILLRFPQEKTIARVGGTEQFRVDVRLIAATNLDLERAVREGRFREDLYYRLNVLHLSTPGLRERGEDVEELAQSFFERFSQELNIKLKGFSQQAIDAMTSYPWPGNVRELMNRIRGAVLLSTGSYVTPADLGLERRSPKRTVVTLEEARDLAEQETVNAALRRTRNNISRAARELGVSRVTLYRLIEKHEIE